jgi:hypothetical protein
MRALINCKLLMDVAAQPRQRPFCFSAASGYWTTNVISRPQQHFAVRL